MSEDRDASTVISRERYIDCCGSERYFLLTEDFLICEGFMVSAIEESVEYGYAFSAYSPVDRSLAVADLRRKIRKGLSTRYLAQRRDGFALSHDSACGYISSEGLVIDGQLVPFEKIPQVLLTYEGWQFSLQITEMDA